jgi:hypothetical protein
MSRTDRPLRMTRPPDRRGAPGAPALAILVLALIVLAGWPARAEEPPAAAGAAPAATLFVPRVFDRVATGDRLVFRYQRTAEPEDPRVPAFDGTATVTLVEAEDRPGREAQVIIAAGTGAGRAAPPLPEAAGHPLLVVFLENTVGTMAAATGGNPTYIRSRLREALWLEAETGSAAVEIDGESHAGRALEVRPFAEDPARNEMGAFADLALRFVVSDEVPGGLAVMEWRTMAAGDLPAITERITYARLEPRPR